MRWWDSALRACVPPYALSLLGIFIGSYRPSTRKPFVPPAAAAEP
jgi:hypothetical protein